MLFWAITAEINTGPLNRIFLKVTKYFINRALQTIKYKKKSLSIMISYHKLYAFYWEVMISFS